MITSVGASYEGKASVGSVGVALHVPLTEAEEPLPGAEASPEADENTEGFERPVKLVEEGSKGLEEVTPVPRGINFELMLVERIIELRLTSVPKGMEGDENTPVCGKIRLELLSVGD